MEKNKKEVLVGSFYLDSSIPNNKIPVGKGMKMILGDPKEKLEQKLAEVERMDKLNAMRIAMTHIETQGLKVNPKKATEIADEFLEWLKKK